MKMLDILFAFYIHQNIHKIMWMKNLTESLLIKCKKDQRTYHSAIKYSLSECILFDVSS